MHILFVIARMLLVLTFIYFGGGKLLDLSGTEASIKTVVTIPDALSGFAIKLQDMTGLTIPRLLAILAGVVEVVGGLLVAFNIATRWASAVLAIIALLTVFYFHDFWNMAGDARNINLIHALKNLSIVGGLLTFVVLGSWRPVPPSNTM